MAGPKEAQTIKHALSGARGGVSQEECDVLVLVMSKYPDQISLSDFRAVMLATLRPYSTDFAGFSYVARSLAPKDWDTDHEVAWNWLWENVERMLKASG